MTSITARAISSEAADCPMARPSAKLCRPMPTAIISERRRASDQLAIPRRRAVSPTVIAPGPNGRAGRAAWRAIHRS
jgi:hypothetical protein